MTLSPRTRWALFSVFAVALAAPTAAQAAQKTVSMGTPRASQKAFAPTATDVNDFFPHRVTIRAGDSVRFVPNGFHTVDLPGPRKTALPLFVPTGQKVSGSLDAAGAPFWFNGVADQLGFNPLLGQPNFGKRLRYNGRTAINSGLPFVNNPRPMRVRFARAGTFRYFCDVHPGMIGIVRVVRRGRRVPSAAADRRAVRRQVAADLGTARRLVRRPAPPANTVDVGREGRGNVSLFAFVPANLTVPRGTTVTFRVQSPTEVHTATTGPGDPEKEPNSYLGVLAGSLESPVPNPAALLPSDPPGPPVGLTPASHGNGFWNSGTIDDQSKSPPPPANAVTFAAPGTYQFYCMIHPFMHATVTVQ